MATTYATIPTPTNGSAVIQQNFVNLAPQIGGQVWRYTTAMSPWARIIPREVWPDGIGDTMKVIYTERSMLGTTGKATWYRDRAYGASSLPTGTTPPDSGTNRGLPPAAVVQHTSRVREFGLWNTSIQSTRIDVLDARKGYQFKEQMNNYMENLIDESHRAWSFRTRNEYFRLCKNKVIIGATATSTSPRANLDVVSPQNLDGMLQYSLAQINATTVSASTLSSPEHSVLTNGVLRGIYSRMNLEGAGRNAPGKANGAPVYPLMCSDLQADFLMREYPQKQIHLYNDAAVLLKPLGVTEAAGGFTYIIDPECPRFTLALNGSLYDFTQVDAWSYQAGFLTAGIASIAAHASNTSLAVISLSSGDTSTGLVAGNTISIAPSSASDGEWSGNFMVVSIDNVSATNTVTIELPANFNSGTGVFSDTATGTLTLVDSNGQSGRVLNTSYTDAPYEMSFIVHPDVMKALVPSEISTIGRGTKFDPLNFTGDFAWINNPNDDNNRRGTIGYFDGLLEFASKPMKTDFGWAIMHRRATPEYLASPSYAVRAGLSLDS